MSKKKTVIPLTGGWPSKERAIAAINALDLSQPWEIEIRPHVEKRSLSQNALYFLWCSKAAEFFSTKGNKYDKEQMHQIFRHLHLGYEDYCIGNTQFKGQLKSTTDLDKQEMHEFMVKVDLWCGDHNLFLPAPENSEYRKEKERNE